MKFREWRQWVRSIPGAMKWFVYLVLFRPIIDSFYYLKHVSIFLSPLYIVGVLTPVLALIAILKYKKPDKTIPDLFFKWWSVFIIISTSAIVFYESPSFMMVGNILKLTLPIFLYFFLRLFIRSKNDLEGILTTFIYSCLFVIIIFLYEVLFNPIRVEYSRGLERIQGSYADVMNYAIYISIGFLSFCYFYFSRSKEKSFFTRIIWVLIVGGICVLALLRIHHLSSYGVFLALCILFLLYNFKASKGTAILLVIFGFIFIRFFGYQDAEEKIETLLKREVEVYKELRDPRYLLHGRWGRWQNLMGDFSNAPIQANLLGMPLSEENVYGYIMIHPHNDYLRIMFFTGIMGLTAYILFLSAIYRRMKYQDMNKKFLGFGALSVLLLYSITTLPTLYPSMLYIIFSVFAYISLPLPKAHHPHQIKGLITNKNANAAQMTDNQ